MRHFGLLGYPLGHSFSKGFFSQACLYDNFEYRNVEDFIANIPPDLEGFNVTIPHKQNIIPYLDEIDPAAAQVGAVNCVKITPQRRLVGYNTDIVGFEESLSLMLCGQRPEALVLGSGGAAHAVWYVLRKMGIEFRTVSRSSPELNYLNLSGDTIAQSLLLVNTTPLGMVPQVDKKADIDYCKITKNHYLYDLIYNPSQTAFLREGRVRGARVKNGLQMLHLQALAAAQIWDLSV